MCIVQRDFDNVNSGLAATLSQHCRSSVHAKNLKAANLEYVGWVEEILSVDYGRYELVVLYCNWVLYCKHGWA